MTASYSMLTFFFHLVQNHKRCVSRFLLCHVVLSFNLSSDFIFLISTCTSSALSLVKQNKTFLVSSIWSAVRNNMRACFQLRGHSVASPPASTPWNKQTTLILLTQRIDCARKHSAFEFLSVDMISLRRARM